MELGGIRRRRKRGFYEKQKKEETKVFFKPVAPAAGCPVAAAVWGEEIQFNSMEGEYGREYQI